jgi:GYF domain 2
MARERWFYAKDMRRMGPLPKRQLVESLLALADPRSSLIWRHGLPAWTPAREVPEIDRQLAPFAATAPAAREAASPAAPPVGAGRVETVPAAPVRGDRHGEGRGARAAPPNVGLYFGGLGVLLLVVVVGWFVWPRSNGPRPVGAAASAANTAPGGALAPSPPRGDGSPPVTAPDPTRPGFMGWSDQEVDLPPGELRHLRGVGAWSGDKLAITLYNGSSWRITEILVRTSRLRGDEFIDSETPHRLQPSAGATVDAGTAQLLDKVAPNRKKAGVNPLDTGPFEATLGPQPEAYRWRIEGARGYPPLSPSGSERQ